MKKLFNSASTTTRLITAALLALLLTSCSMFPYLDTRLGTWVDDNATASIVDPVTGETKIKAGLPVHIIIEPDQDSDIRSVSFTATATIPFPGFGTYETQWNSTQFGSTVVNRGNPEVSLYLEWSKSRDILYGSGVYNMCGDSDDPIFVQPPIDDADGGEEAEIELLGRDSLGALMDGEVTPVACYAELAFEARQLK